MGMKLFKMGLFGLAALGYGLEHFQVMNLGMDLIAAPAVLGALITVFGMIKARFKI